MRPGDPGRPGILVSAHSSRRNSFLLLEGSSLPDVYQRRYTRGKASAAEHGAITYEVSNRSRTCNSPRTHPYVPLYISIHMFLHGLRILKCTLADSNMILLSIIAFSGAQVTILSAHGMSQDKIIFCSPLYALNKEVLCLCIHVIVFSHHPFYE